MSTNNGQIATLLGDIPEYGGGPRVLLPASYYIGTLEVDEVDMSPEREGVIENEDGSPFLDANDNEVTLGHSPYAQMTCEVDEGPFAGNGFTGRFWLTPGKGRNIGFVQHAAKAISGQGVNTKVLSDFGFEFPAKQTQEEAQQMYRRYFYALGAEDRVTFMTKYCNIGKWDGKSVVVKVGIEDGNEKQNETTGELYTPQFNRFQGFSSLNAGKKGAGWVRNVCHPKQENWAIELGLVEGPAPQATDAVSA